MTKADFIRLQRNRARATRIFKATGGDPSRIRDYEAAEIRRREKQATHLGRLVCLRAALEGVGL